MRLWRCLPISKKEIQINEEIRDKELRIIGSDGQQLGIMSAKADKIVTKNCVILAKNASELSPGLVDKISAGFIVSKKVGGSVERNRTKRRLRAAVAALFPVIAAQGYAYVIIARKSALMADFEEILRDLRYGIKKLTGVVVKD